jgi:hypothetical protein
MRRTAAIAALTLTAALVATPAGAAPRTFTINVFSKQLFAAGNQCLYAHGGTPSNERLVWVWPSGRQMSSATCTIG